MPPRAPSTGAAAPEVLGLRDLNRATLARQLLLAREKIKPLRAIERVGGLQAQWPKPPHVGLWTRVEGYDREHLLALLRRHDAVRVSTTRGTLHIVSAEDYVTLRPALQPMLTRGVAAVLRDRMKGLVVDEVVAEGRAILAKGPATFEQVRDALAKLHGTSSRPADARAMGFIVRLGMPLVQVPIDDHAWGFPTSPAFALADAWIGKELASTGTLDALVLRYLAAFGPATASDVQTWSGVQGLKEVVESLRGQLVVLRDERKRELFDVPKGPRPGGDADAPPRFLPEFDNLVLAHTDRSRFVADVHRKRVYLPGLRIAPTFLVDGFVAGTWGVARKKKDAVLTVAPFAPLAKKPRADLEAEAERLARFMEPDAITFTVRLAPTK